LRHLRQYGVPIPGRVRTIRPFLLRGPANGGIGEKTQISRIGVPVAFVIIRKNDRSREYGRPMIEDELLKLRFKRGSEDALRRIYEKYLNYLLSVAMAFLNDAHASEDVVHDIFVTLAQSAGTFCLRGSLKGCLATCVANRARDRRREGRRHANRLAVHAGTVPQSEPPEDRALCDERTKQIYEALAQLPDEQRETIVLHVKADMKFQQIAEIQNASYVAVQARYRRGMDKLRSILNGRL
jgi:RNA polymerase sigma-70 factor (ECF subfamily)